MSQRKDDREIADGCADNRGDACGDVYGDTQPGGRSDESDGAEPVAGTDGVDPIGDGSTDGPGDEADEAAESWDAHDERRRKDCFAPPAEPCECYCLHCGRTFTSDQIWFQRVVGDPMGFEGFWMCPTPNCDGAGFTFDIFPTDPDHPANEGWHSFEDEEDADGEEGEWDDGDDPDAEYDPSEQKYKVFDEIADEEEDIEGEEWKYGLQPGEKPPEADWVAEARREWEQLQRKYDEPDERPREVDWTSRQPRPRNPDAPDAADTADDSADPNSPSWREDDIPF